jgi:phosphatidate cytidylyltransferase
MSPELRNRLLIGPVLGGTAFGLVIWDILAGVHYGSVILASIVALTASREYARLVRGIAPGVQTAPIIIATLLLVATVWPGPAAIGLEPSLPLGTLVISLVLVWACLAQMARHALQGFSANVATTMLGVIYIGVAMQLLAALSIHGGSAEDPSRGAKLLILAISACKFGDIFAFFGGRRFGRHKLAPAISPGKTWEGFVASLFGAVGGTFLMTWLLQLLSAPAAFDQWWQPVVWGLVLGPAGVIGDLVESCFKRTAAMKDSGGGIPGFGGFLDVFDAVLIAAPIAYGLALVL